MIIPSHRLSTFISLLTIALLTISSSSYVNDRQSLTLHQDATVKGSAFINIEEFLQLQTPFKLTLDAPHSCQTQTPSLSLSDEVSFQGSFSNGDRVFILGDHYYGIRIDPQTNQINLAIYTLNNTEGSSKRSFIQNQRFLFKHDIIGDHEIVQFQFFALLGIFRTSSQMLVINFVELSSPNLLGVFSIEKSPVHCFGIINGKTLYVAAENSIIVYDLSTTEKIAKGKAVSTFTDYSLPNGVQQQIESIQSVGVCEDIVLLAQGDRILATKEKSTAHNSSSLTILKAVTMDSEILHMQKVGRSLVLMTANDLIEYVFTTDCLTMRVNLRLSLNQLDFASSLPTQDKKLFSAIKDSNKGRYFGVINKIKKEVFIFEVAAIRTADNGDTPYIYAYKSQDPLETVDLFDYFTSYSLNGIGMITKRKHDFVSVSVLIRKGAGISCSRTFPGTEELSVKAQSQFCHNQVYNYTQFVEKELIGKSTGSYSNEVFFDPSQYCERIVALEVSYGWSTALIVGCAVLLVGSIIVIILFINKRSKKKKVAKYRGHKRFHDEKGALDNSQSNNKIDISSLTLPSGTDRREDGDASMTQSRRKGYVRKDKQKKSFSKKKNLTIRIPEQ